MWICQIVLDNPASAVVSGLFNDLVEITREPDAFSLSHIVGLDDVGFPLLYCAAVFIDEIVSELACLHRKDPGSREELESLRIDLLDLDEIARQKVLATDAMNSRILIYFLVGLHSGEEVGSDAAVVPGNIPVLCQLVAWLAADDAAIVVFFVLFEPKSTHHLSCLLHNIVVGAVHVHDRPSLLLLLQHILLRLQCIHLQDL